jgi:DNA-binding response OmpR family regulator
VPMETLPHSQSKREARQQTRRIQLLDGPAIAGYRIQRNEESHVMVIDNLILQCTPDEYRLLVHLMEQHEQPVSFEDLIAHFQDASTTEPALLKMARKKLTATLSNLRAKLWPTDFTIVRVVDVGYLLTLQNKLWSLNHADLHDSL